MRCDLVEPFRTIIDARIRKAYKLSQINQDDFDYIDGQYRIFGKAGYRLQYSMFEIKNSKRVLDVVTSEIKNRFEKKFAQTDSIIVLRLSEQCKIDRYGYAKNDEEELIFVQ